MNIEPTVPTATGPSDCFTGDVYIDTFASPKTDGQRANVGRVRFTPGARTAWHSHDLGQTLHIVEGTALIGTRDGAVITARPGDTIYTPPGEEHWHGATPTGFMEHLAVYDTSAEPPLGVHWLEHVTDEDYSRR